MTSLSFGPECRLLQASEFQHVFDHTLCKVHQPAFLLLATPSSSARLGFIVAKRKIRRAHERNRVKRLARESFRLHRQQLPALDIVLMAKPDAQLLPNDELHQQLSTAWRQLARKAANRPQARDG
jgi:ribonuclease P protein component